MVMYFELALRSLIWSSINTPPPVRNHLLIISVSVGIQLKKLHQANMKNQRDKGGEMAQIKAFPEQG